MQWLNEALSWQENDNNITITASGDTDFWRVTRHGFIKDDGHFYFQEVAGNFRARVKVFGDYHALYDQAGLMLRLDETTWMKCGIEFVDNQQFVSAVITRQFSDWSIVPLASNPDFIWMQVERIGTAIEVAYSLDGDSYQMLRQGYLSDSETLQVGVMVAAPKGEGFKARFEQFTVEDI